MYNQYDQLQSHTFREATSLAARGEEFSHLVKLLDPNNALRLKIYVQGLPDYIREKTIYGKSVSKNISTNKKNAPKCSKTEPTAGGLLDMY